MSTKKLQIIDKLIKNEIIHYNSISEMKADSKLKANIAVLTLGYYEANDGGGATYYIREKTDSDVDDGGSVIILGSDYIAELVTNNKEINVLQFGAVGDGVTDDTRAIQNAMNYANVLSFVPKDTEYLIESSVISNKRITINGNGAKIRSSSIEGEQGAKRLFVFNNGCHVSDLSFYSTNDQKIEVSFRDGNVWDETHGYSSNVIALTLYSGDNSTIRNINTYEINCPVSVGILDGETIKHIVIENVVAYDCVFGINFTNVEDIKISKCYITLDKTLGSGTPHCYYTWGGVNGVFISDCTAISYGNVISLIRFRDTSGLEDISYNRNININNVVCIIPEGSSSVGLEFLGGFDRANINGYYQKNGVALTKCALESTGDVTVNNFKWDINSVITINTWGTIIRPTANDSHSGISLFSNGVINDNNVLSEESETPYFIILGNGKAYFENVDFNLKRSYAQSTGNYFVFKNCNIVCDYRFDFRPTNDTYIDVIGCYVKELSKENATRLNGVFSYSTEGNTVRVISSLCENYVDDNLAPNGGTVIMYNSTILERTS